MHGAAADKNAVISGAEGVNMAGGAPADVIRHLPFSLAGRSCRRRKSASFSVTHGLSAVSPFAKNVPAWARSAACPAIHESPRRSRRFPAPLIPRPLHPFIRDRPPRSTTRRDTGGNDRIGAGRSFSVVGARLEGDIQASLPPLRRRSGQPGAQSVPHAVCPPLPVRGAGNHPVVRLTRMAPTAGLGQTSPSAPAP